MSKFSGKVKELSEKNFDSSYNLKGGKEGIVVFYATWCGYCQMLIPEYQKLSKKITAYAIDIDKNPKLVKHFQIQGFPTLRYINKNGKIDSETYMGERTSEKMYNYIKSRNMKGGKKLIKKKPVKKIVKKKPVKKVKKVVKKKPVKKVKKVVKKKLVKK